MYANRFERAKPNPLSLTAAIGINAALVAALLFSAPEIAERFETPFEAYSVTDDPPPPPVPPEPVKSSVKSALSDPLIVTPIPEVSTVTDNRVTSTDVPQPPVPPIPLPPPPDPGSALSLDPPKPAPVLVEAAPLRGVDFQPEYPPAERRTGTEGSVTVRVLVGADGRVKAVEGIRSAGDAFFQATRRQALARWRFTPATRDGVPYESWRTMTVRFVLEG